jgi:hypothetical protein
LASPRRGGGGLVAAKLRVLGEPVDGVDPEAVDAAIEPEAEDSVQRRLYLGVVPVEVGLLRRERVQIVLSGRLVERPRRTDGGE